MKEVPDSLLATDKPAAVAVHNENGPSSLLIVVDHADNLTPQAFGRLGIPESIPESEYLNPIASDIGVAEASRVLAEALDATLA
jgi:predicted N-formylglutamate amidohydrolase